MVTRYRVMGAISGTTANEAQLYYNASSVTTSKPSQNIGKYAEMADEVTVGFSGKRNRGELINSPMTRLEWSYSGAQLNTSSWTWVKDPGQPQWWTGAHIGFSMSDPIGSRFGTVSFPSNKLPAWDETKAGIALAAARAGAAEASSQVLVTIGEARETFRMLESGVNLLLKRTEPFRVLRRRYEQGKLTYKDFLVEMANLDLLIRYGVMPLVYDLQGLVKAFSEPTKPDRRSSRSTYGDSGTSTWFSTVDSSMVASIKLNSELSWTRQYRATTLYESSDTLQARLGLRLADVPPAALELVRLGFVANWFVNFREYLGSLMLEGRATCLLQCVVETLTGQYDAVYEESGSKQSAGSTSVCSSNGSGSKVTIVFTRKTRKPYSNQDYGTLAKRVQLTPARILDGLSLLATNLDISDRKRRIVRI